MSKLRIQFEPYADTSGQAFVPLEVINSKLERVGNRLYDLKLNEPLDLDVPPDRFLVQAFLPSGEVLRKQVSVEAGTTQSVSLAPKRLSPREDLAWGYYLQRPERTQMRASAKTPMALTVNGKPQLGIWRSRGLEHWEIAPEISVSRNDMPLVEDPLSLERLTLRTEGQTLWLHVVWEATKGKFVALPPAEKIRINVREDEIPGADPDPTNVLVDSGNPQAEAILSFLTRGDFANANAIGDQFARNAEQLLANKVQDPAAAAIGGYYLLLAGDLTKLHDWTSNLDNWFPFFSDGAVIHGWHALKQPSPDFELAGQRLLAAVDRGLPVYSCGLRLLVDGLSMLSWRTKQQASGSSSELERALTRVRRYAAVADTQAVTTTYYALNPEQPSP